MKRTKKILSIMLTIIMAIAMSVPVFAAQEGTLTGGSITINNAVSGQTYNAYQILYIESYNASTGAYAYKANSAWETWLKTQTSYLSFDDQGYVTWVSGADTAAFAKAAQAEAEKMTADATDEATSETVEFKNLKLGYYLVDTTLGTICFLNTTNPSATINEKNSEPTIEKKVKEDSTGNYGDENTAQIGDTVEFKTTVHAKKGAQNYVVHDVMSAGLTLNQDSIIVKVGETALTKDTEYTVAFKSSDAVDDTASDGASTVDNTDNNSNTTTAVGDSCDFHITFAQTYLDTITADTDITITYTAILNDKAVISTDSNTNKTKLDYGSDAQGNPSGETEWDETKTYTFKFDIIKTDADKKLLTGAKFELYDAQTGGNKISLVKESDGVYRVATAEEKTADGFTAAVIEAGKAAVKGLDANTTYYLEETQAPAGYNKLSVRVSVHIVNSNLTTTMTGDTWSDGDGGIQITNNTGTELPATGGIGTTIFYTAGVILALCAAVMLVAKDV